MVYLIIGIALFAVMLVVAMRLDDWNVFAMFVMGGMLVVLSIIGTRVGTQKELARHPELNPYTTKVVYEKQDSVHVAVDTIVVKKD